MDEQSHARRRESHFASLASLKKFLRFLNLQDKHRASF